MSSDRPDFRYSFAHTPYVRPRMEPVRGVVIHTTGGIRPPRGVFETLKSRRLSVHYIVGSDGEVLQTAPHSLVETLCDQLQLPRVVPTEADGSLLRREMTDAELAGFRGVMGHLHAHPSKIDPGVDILDTLRLRWLVSQPRAANSSR
jgi:hypothetical protein